MTESATGEAIKRGRECNLERCSPPAQGKRQESKGWAGLPLPKDLPQHTKVSVLPGARKKSRKRSAA